MLQLDARVLQCVNYVIGGCSTKSVELWRNVWTKLWNVENQKSARITLVLESAYFYRVLDSFSSGARCWHNGRHDMLWLHSIMSIRVPGCQKLQTMA